MKKRVLSLLLALTLCFSMLPMAVLAEEAGVTAVQTAQSGTADGGSGDADTIDAGTVDEGTAVPDETDGGITLFAEHTGNHGIALPAGETWQGISRLASISGPGYYYLTQDVKVTAAAWQPKDGVVLDLNGYSISASSISNANGGVIKIASGVTFTLTDCNGSGKGNGIITHDSEKNGRGVFVDGGGIFYMYGGTITANHATLGNTVYGGGVYVEGVTRNSDTVGTFHMYGGTISSNTVYNSTGISGGAGVYVGEGAAFYLRDGTVSGNRALESTRGSSSGGGVYVESKGTFVFEKGSVSGNYAPSTGGGIFVDTDGVFTMADGTVTGNYAGQGGGVYVCSNSTGTAFTMTGGTIGGSTEDAANTAKFGGGVYTKGNCTLSGDAAISGNEAISSGEITNKDGHGGGVYIESGAFVLSGNAKVSGNTAKYGGGVSFFTEDTSASFTMSGSAAVSGNTAESYGGIAVLGGSFTMESGKITLNKATAGSAGGVGVGNGGSFTMQGGIISGNQARSTNKPEGGGVMCGVYHGDYADTSKVDATGRFTMSGGAITGNNITGTNAKGGGVLLGPGSTMTVSGDVQITDNWRGGELVGDVYEKGTDGTANNLWLDAYKDFDGVLQWACLSVVGQLSDTVTIGVGATAATKTEPAIIAVGDGYVLTAADKAHFTSDSGSYRVKYDGANSRMLLVSTEHVAHPICGASCVDGTHAEEAYWRGVSDLSAINVPGNYYLTKDIELTDTWNPGYGVVLCLNGHSITSKAYNTIKVKANCSLTLTDCNRSGEGNGKLKHAVDPNNSAYFVSGNAVYVAKDGVFVLYGGTITENEVLYNGNFGGAVAVSKGGSFQMHGGSITGNRIRFGLGGVVYVAGDFVMTGGEIAGNQAVRTESAGKNTYDKNLAYGGGVYVAQSGTMTVSGNVKIAQNERIVIDNATNYNILSRATGNVYLTDGRTITISSALTGGDKSIGVTVATPPVDESTVTVAAGSSYTLTDTDAAAFAADAGSDYRVQPNGNTLELAVKIHKHYLCGGSTCNGAGGHTCEETIFTKWTDAANLPDSAGNWYLTTDVVISAAWEPMDGTVLDLNGHSIAVNGTATQGTNAITVKKGVHFTLTDCNGDDGVHRFTKYVQTTSTGLNGLFIPDDAGDIEITGGVITRFGDSEHRLGRGVYVYGASSVFTMYGGTICGNYFTNGGAGMTIYSGTVNMYGGEIRGNCVSVSAGAGVRIEEFGNFNMAGDAVIRENVSISTTDYGSRYGGGGGVYVYGKFTMSEHARIEDNRADKGDGGGVLVNSKGTFKMIGGSNYTIAIDDNYARDNGGGVYMDGTFEISGGVQSWVNSNGGTSNIYLTAGKTITITGNLLNFRNLGLTLETMPTAGNPVAFAKAGKNVTLSDRDADAFYADEHYSDDAYSVQRDGNTLYLYFGTPHKHPVCGKSCADTAHDSVLWTGIASLSEITGDGSYYLTNVVTLDEKWVCSYDISLCLNGYSITADGDFDAIEVGAGKSFTLSDCNGTNGQYAFRWLYALAPKWNPTKLDDGTNTKFIIDGGVITHAKSMSGRGVLVSDGASFTMYGGAIVGNMVETAGAGVSVAATASFSMYGGEITANVLSAEGSSGGGIWSAGTVVIGGSAQILRNSALRGDGGSGGGIYSSGTLTLTGSAAVRDNTIRNNTSSTNAAFGGGIYSAGTLTIAENAEVTGNSITNSGANGGGVYVASGSMTLRDNAKITDNSILNATSMMRGCGVFIADGATLSVSGAVQVTDNRDSYSIPANVLLSGTDSVNPITVIGALNGASIGVRVPGSVLATIDDTHAVIIATAAAEGWIAADSFTGDNDEYPLRTSADGKTAQLCNHIHTWTYTTSEEDTADGETAYTIAAACTKTGCTTSGGSVILSVQKVYTYDGSAKPVTVTDTLTTGDKVSAVTYTRKNGANPITLDGAPTDAGEYIASITVGEGAGAVAAEVTYKIDRLTPEASDFTFIPPTRLDYDGHEKLADFHTTLPVTYDVRYSYAGSDGYISAPIGVGTYTVKVSVNYGTNWNSVTLSNPSWTFSILPVDYSVDIPAAWNEQRVIEGSSVFFALHNISAFNVTWTGVNNERFSNSLKWYTDSSCTTEVDRNTAFGTAGSATLYWKFEFDSPDGNYIEGSKTGSIVVTVVKGAPQNVQFWNRDTEGTKTYGSAPFTLGAKNYTYEDGAIDDGTLTYTSSNPSVATIDASTGVITLHSVGTTVITATAPMVPGRYTETSATYTLTATPKELQGICLEIISGGEKFYDGTDSADIVVAVESKYLAPGDTLTVSGSAKYSSSDVWESSTITFIPDAITTGNYRLSSDPVTFYGVRILPVTITVTPDAGQHKTYGTADPILTYTHSSAVNGEVPAFDGALARAAGENAGSYAIHVGTLACKDEGSFLAQNYTLEFSTDVVNFTIDKATPTITAAASPKVIKNGLDTDISGWASFDNTDSGAKLVYTLEGAPAGITLTGSMLKAANAATTAGSFTVRVSAAATDNFNAPADVLITVTAVEKANAGVRITNAPGSKTYGDKNFTLTATKTAPDGGTWSWTSTDADILEIVSGADTETPTIAVKKADAAGAALTVVYTSATHYGTDTVTITVAAKAVTADMIADMPAATYTGSAILPTPAVKHGAAALVPGTDFDFGYADNTNAGSATLTVTGKGNYTGTAAKAFTILPKSLGGAAVTLDSAALPYSGTEQTVNVVSVTLAGWTPAITAADYEIAGSSNKATDAADSITLTIRGKGNYTGTATTTWKIDRIDPEAADFDVTPALPAAPVYDGNSKTVTVAPKSGIRGMGAVKVYYAGIFDITYPKSETAPTDAGTYKVTASVADGSNYKAAELDLGTLTVGQAAGGTLTAYNLSQKYRDLTPKTIAPDYGELPAGQKWTYSITDTAFTGAAAVDPASVTVGADTGVMTYRLIAGEKDDTVTWTVTVSCRNYTEFTKKVVLTLTKDQQATLYVTGKTTVVYGETLQLGTEGGSGTGAVTYAVVGGTGNATIDENGVLTPVKVGTVKVTATKDGDVDFDPVTGAEVEITITQAASTGEPKHTRITSGGKTLDDAKLTTVGSTLSPAEGVLEWIDDAGNVLPGDTKVEAGKNYKWRFTPTDGNYAPLTGEIRLFSRSGNGNYTYYYIEVTAGKNGSVSPAGHVSVRKDMDMPFTITPDEGYTVVKVLVDGKDVGAVTSYTFEKVTKAHTIEAVFAKPGETSGKFVDVPADSYYKEAVDWAVENDIVSGVSDTRFDPDGFCTRAQAITLLWRMAGSPAPKSTSHNFTDVKPGSYYEQAVLWGVENGIIVGTSKTAFAPDGICTRAHAVVLLYRAAGNPAGSGTARFSDVAADAYYANAVAWAEEKGITTGIGGGLFGADNHCTRAQIVTFLWRAIVK